MTKARRVAHRADFFNSQILIKKTSTTLSFIEKFEFLMQSATLQMDDELIGWIMKFFDSVAVYLGSTYQKRHPIFYNTDLNLFNPKQQVHRQPDGV